MAHVASASIPETRVACVKRKYVRITLSEYCKTKKVIAVENPGPLIPKITKKITKTWTVCPISWYGIMEINILKDIEYEQN